MQSVLGGSAANKQDRHFANPSVGSANYPRKLAALPPACHERLTAPVRSTRAGAEMIWRAVPPGTARLAAFISVSGQSMRTPMNSPFRSAHPDPVRSGKRVFEEGCSSNLTLI